MKRRLDWIDILAFSVMAYCASVVLFFAIVGTAFAYHRYIG